MARGTRDLEVALIRLLDLVRLFFKIVEESLMVGERIADVHPWIASVGLGQAGEHQACRSGEEERASYVRHFE